MVALNPRAPGTSAGVPPFPLPSEGLEAMSLRGANLCTRRCLRLESNDGCLSPHTEKKQKNRRRREGGGGPFLAGAIGHALPGVSASMQATGWMGKKGIIPCLIPC